MPEVSEIMEPRREAVPVIRTPVSSSNVRSVGYDADSRVLEVEFHDGGVYQYYDVPRSVHQGLVSAASHGSYLHAHIRDRYRYRQTR